MDLKEIVKILTDKGLTISAMESCTGGGFTNALTNIEGASEVIKFSAVTYANEFKIKMGVDEKILNKYTVYSFEVADEMSSNISKFADSDIGVGITGKLNRVDKYNPYGEDNVVYVSVFDKKNDKHYHELVKATLASRKENKELVIQSVSRILSEILK